MKLNYIAKSYDQDKKLKDILKKRLYISTELLKKLKYSNCIFVNNKEEFVNYLVKENDTVTVDLEKYLNIKDTPKFEDKFILKDAPLDILYEDEYLLIVNKPENMPSHPSTDNYDNTLSNIVAAYLKKQGINNIHIVTRLDKNTTGICIFAKNEYIQELFVRRKEKLNLKKEYIAIVNGIVKENHGIIEKNIARIDNTIILRHTVNDNTGDYAKTEYNVLARNEEKNYTVVNVLLHTGRTHQIRVHMIDLGHILLGDTLYAEHYGIRDIDKLISRQALHAHSISFNHPITDEFIQIQADIPNDMKNLI
ncbi:MAG: RluA family pseudouridine synthase [Clostridia bacterium]|nr:RluA family pseudouridine synthase [Clostridia bacterium]